MRNPKSISIYFRAIFLLYILRDVGVVRTKSTIEPCTYSESGSCHSLVGYTLYTDLSVVEVARLFGIEALDLLAANSINFNAPGVSNYILPSGLFLVVPLICSCSASSVRRSSAHYLSILSDTLEHISSSVYGGLVTSEQLMSENNISDMTIPSQTNLTINFPCACFDQMDNNSPAIYLSYVVKWGESLRQIAAKYSRSLTDIMSVNKLQSDDISPGDILVLPLAACASNFTKYASDYGLVVMNNSYVITAGGCVECSCRVTDFKDNSLRCVISSLPASCTSMQCRNSDLMLGNFTATPSRGCCKVSSCIYSGIVDGIIWMTSTDSCKAVCPVTPRQPILLEASSLHTVAPTATRPAANPTPTGSGGPVPAPLDLPPPPPAPAIHAPPHAPPLHNVSSSSTQTSLPTLPLILVCFYSNFMPLFQYL